MPSNRTISLFALLLTGGSHLLSQGHGPKNPSKEYIRLGGQIVAIENASPSAKYIGLDTTTQGTWTGKYGAGGELIANDLTNAPAYATAT